MKKLMLALTVAAMAIGAQAATVSWSSGVFNTPNGVTSADEGKSTGVYEAIFSVYSDAAGNNLLGSTSSTSVKKSGNMTGTVDITKPASGTEQTFYTKLVIRDIATGKEMDSGMGTFTWNGDALADPELTFYGSEASGFATLPPNAGASGGSWGAVPEPTSGILMLVGLGALALRRRKQA